MSSYTPIPEGAQATPQLFNDRFQTLNSAVQQSQDSILDLYNQGFSPPSCTWDPCDALSGITTLTSKVTSSNASISALQTSLTSSQASITQVYADAFFKPAGGSAFQMLRIGSSGGAVEWTSDLVVSRLTVTGAAAFNNAIALGGIDEPASVSGFVQIFHDGTANVLKAKYPGGSVVTLGS